MNFTNLFIGICLLTSAVQTFSMQQNDTQQWTINCKVCNKKVRTSPTAITAFHKECMLRIRNKPICQKKPENFKQPWLDKK